MSAGRPAPVGNGHGQCQKIHGPKGASSDRALGIDKGVPTVSAACDLRGLFGRSYKRSFQQYVAGKRVAAHSVEARVPQSIVWGPFQEFDSSDDEWM
jgi:hypothetical protein